MGSYWIFRCRVFFAYVVGVSPMELVEGVRFCVTFAVVVPLDIGSEVWGVPFCLTTTYHSSFFSCANAKATSKGFREWGLRKRPNNGIYHTGSGRSDTQNRRDGKLHRMKTLVGRGQKGKTYFFGHGEVRRPISPYLQQVVLRPVTMTGMFQPSTYRELGMERKTLQQIVISKLYPVQVGEVALSIFTN